MKIIFDKLTKICLILVMDKLLLYALLGCTLVAAGGK